jgi:predicted amidohydrolase YtcJ
VAHRTLLLSFAIVCAFLAPALSLVARRPSSPPPSPAELVLKHGDFFTGVSEAPRATGMAINDGVIVAVTSKDDALEPYIGSRTRVIDLGGQFAMPGWNDAHVHLAAAGYAKMDVNLFGTHSVQELQLRVRDRLSEYSPGQWIIGWGWDHTLWPEKKFPTRQDLDAVSTDHPIFLERIDGHVAVVNSLALKIAGITSKTLDPPGGRIERDPKTGRPTGMLEENSAMNLAYGRIPPYSIDRRRRALELALQEAAHFGVTSVQDNSVQTIEPGDNYGWGNFLVLEEMKREGKLKVRVTEWLPFDAPLDQLEKMRQEGGGSSALDPGDPWLKTGQLKGFLDGSLGSRTAALLDAYADSPDTSGILRMQPEELKKAAIERDRAGFQIGFHAIGDRANRVALDTFAAITAANPPRDRRDRIEHAQVVSSQDFARFASLDVIASMQPSHLLDDERWAEDRLGPERIKGAYAWHTMLQVGAHLAFGTDFPVESIDPLRGLYACLTRQPPGGGGPANGWQPQEKISAFDCVQAYTVGSAYAQFEEKHKGLLEPGMLADIVVYPADLTALAPASLLEQQVSMTITGGRIAYEKK